MLETHPPSYKVVYYPDRTTKILVYFTGFLVCDLSSRSLMMFQCNVASYSLLNTYQKRCQPIYVYSRVARLVRYHKPPPLRPMWFLNPGLVLRRRSRRTLWRNICLNSSAIFTIIPRQTHPGHSTIHNHFLSIDKARIITREEHDHLRLFNRLPEPARGEMNLPALPLLLIIPEPILQQRRIQRRGTQRIEPIPYHYQQPPPPSSHRKGTHLL